MRIWELKIYEECCIRETRLQSDTTKLGREIREYRNEVNILQEEKKEDGVIMRSQDAELALFKKDVADTKAQLKKENDRNKILRKILWFTGSLAALSTGILTAQIVIQK